jgi:hypothetical protein
VEAAAPRHIGAAFVLRDRLFLHRGQVIRVFSNKPLKKLQPRLFFSFFSVASQPNKATKPHSCPLRRPCLGCDETGRPDRPPTNPAPARAPTAHDQATPARVLRHHRGRRMRRKGCGGTENAPPCPCPDYQTQGPACRPGTGGAMDPTRGPRPGENVGTTTPAPPPSSPSPAPKTSPFTSIVPPKTGSSCPETKTTPPPPQQSSASTTPGARSHADFEPTMVAPERRGSSNPTEPQAAERTRRRAQTPKATWWTKVLHRAFALGPPNRYSCAPITPAAWAGRRRRRKKGQKLDSEG